MLTMINGEHLRGSLYGVTFSGSLLKRQFDRMIKLFISIIISASQIIQTFCLYILYEKFSMFGIKQIDSKSKSFYLNRKR